MKPRVILLLPAILAMVLILGACGTAEPAVEDAPEAETAEIQEEIQQPPDTSDEELLELGNQQVLEQYNFAMYLAAGAVFQQDWEDTVTDENGQFWSRVTDSRVHSLADIEDVWHTYFAPSTALPEGMLDLYKEMDGALWSGNTGVGDNFTDIELTEVTNRESGVAVLTGERFFNIGGEDREAGGTIDYTLVWEDGAWRCREIALDGEPWSFARIP